jgi:glutathione S-transferase
MEVMSPLVDPEVRTLEGLHLFHDAWSLASQQVRLVLAEKGVSWTSHAVDLRRGEHDAASYRVVNPSGEVPMLVHDGRIFVDAHDVMEYLDDQYPQVPLRPATSSGLIHMREWVARQETIHRALDVLSQEFVFGPLDGTARPTPAVASIACAVRTVEVALDELDRQLEGRSWVVGDGFSLADVAWAIDLHRLAVMAFPLGGKMGVRRLVRRVRQRPSFGAAVLAYEPPGIRRTLVLDRLRRWVVRSHLGAAKWRDPRLFANA